MISAWQTGMSGGTPTVTTEPPMPGDVPAGGRRSGIPRPALRGAWGSA